MEEILKTLTIVFTDGLYVSELYYYRLKSCETILRSSVSLKLETFKNRLNGKFWGKLLPPAFPVLTF